MRLPSLHWFGPLPNSRVIVYVHGYATDWQSEGLFSSLATNFAPEVTSLLMDLSDYDLAGNCYFLPLSAQHARLDSVYAQLKPMGVNLSIIGHSLGCAVLSSWLANNQADFDHVIYLAPSLRDDPGPKIAQRIQTHPRFFEEKDGQIGFVRKEGTKTFISPQFIKEFSLKVTPNYLKVAQRLKTHAILAEQDNDQATRQELEEFFGATTLKGANHNFLTALGPLTEALNKIIKA